MGSTLVYRLVFDRDTGKPKGYGFCEFAGTLFSLHSVHIFVRYLTERFIFPTPPPLGPPFVLQPSDPLKTN